MAHYGNEFTSGRYMRPGQSRMTGGYDTGYRGGDQWGGSSFPRGGWQDHEGHHGFGSWGRGFSGDLDESWGSTAHGRGRRDFGEGYGSTGAPYGSTSGGYGTSSRHGASGGYGTSGGYGSMGSRFDHSQGGYGGSMRGGYYDQDTHRFGRRMGHDYDEDFGDRIRRGWDRFRNEARGWMGRGYDRGW